MLPNPQETADLLTFTEEILNRNIQFLCSAFFFGTNFFLLNAASNDKTVCLDLDTHIK